MTDEEIARWGRAMQFLRLVPRYGMEIKLHPLGEVRTVISRDVVAQTFTTDDRAIHDVFTTPYQVVSDRWRTGRTPVLDLTRGRGQSTIG